MLVISRREGESFLVGSNIEIIIKEISKDSIKISIDAPKEIPIIRKELIEASNINRQACSIIDTDTILDLKKNIKKTPLI